MVAPAAGLPPSAVALGDVLDEDGEDAAAVRKVFHRTMLWKYRTGRCLPDARRSARLHKLTKGRVAAHGWSTETEAA